MWGHEPRAGRANRCRNRAALATAPMLGIAAATPMWTCAYWPQRRASRARNIAQFMASAILGSRTSSLMSPLWIPNKRRSAPIVDADRSKCDFFPANAYWTRARIGPRHLSCRTTSPQSHPGCPTCPYRVGVRPSRRFESSDEIDIALSGLGPRPLPEEFGWADKSNLQGKLLRLPRYPGPRSLFSSKAAASAPRRQSAFWNTTSD